MKNIFKYTVKKKYLISGNIETKTLYSTTKVDFVSGIGQEILDVSLEMMSPEEAVNDSSCQNYYSFQKNHLGLKHPKGVYTIIFLSRKIDILFPKSTEFALFVKQMSKNNYMYIVEADTKLPTNSTGSLHYFYNIEDAKKFARTR